MREGGLRALRDVRLHRLPVSLIVPDLLAVRADRDEAGELTHLGERLRELGVGGRERRAAGFFVPVAAHEHGDEAERQQRDHADQEADGSLAPDVAQAVALAQQLPNGGGVLGYAFDSKAMLAIDEWQTDEAPARSR